LTVKPTVLIVEDEILIAMGLRYLLEDLGCNVIPAAANGPDAIARCARYRPDLVLMDVHLQGPMDGIEAGARIEKDHAIPVVFVTANESVLAGRTIDGIHAVRFIPKPVEPSALSDLIDSIRRVHAV
jgi:CheY-like chemotaxis protein